MSLRAFKYLSPLLLYALAALAFTGHGWLVWTPVLYGFVLIPLAELFIRPDPRNLSSAEEELARTNKWFDMVLYLTVPFQYAALAFFLFTVSFQANTGMEIAGKTVSMGLLCGVFGINVAHELGHRVNRGEQFLAKSLLLTSLYMHFFIEHNRGHHKRVATPEDPSSARYGEMVYAFYARTIIFSYLSAWEIAAKEMHKKGYKLLSVHNEMLLFQFLQAAFLVLIGFLFGWQTMLLFVAAAVLGILLLETVNYIEHYGLQRRSLAEGKYERAMPVHSWNSDHVIG